MAVMPAKSVKQQQAMGIAHAIQKGEMSPSKAGPEVRRMAREMEPGDVTDFASTSHSGLPKKACMSMEEIGARIVNQILAEDGPEEEAGEIAACRDIIKTVDELRSSIPNPSPEMLRRIMRVRSTANAMLRRHLGGSPEPEEHSITLHRAG